jgi:hypothetical protein
MSYTNSTPQASDQIANTQPLILNNFAFLEDSINQEHNFNAADPTQTYHLQASMPNLSGSPSLPAGTNGLYYVSGGNARFYDGTNISKLTEAVPTPIGYQWIGRTLIQWGLEGVSGTGPQPGTTNYSTAFSAAPFIIQTTPFFGNSTPQGVMVVAIQSVSGSPSTTQFSWVFNTNSGDYSGFYWMAIGT